MGFLRTLLALLVAVAHIRPIGTEATPILGGAVFAVKAFFVISGFYMALVLDGQYRSRPVRTFYLSRFTRILPIYWFMTLLAGAAEWLLVPRGGAFHPLSSPIERAGELSIGTLPWPILAYIGVALLTTIGLDSGQWLGFSRLTGELGIAPDFLPAATSVTALAPVPAAWTLSIELLFYLIAPFVVRRSLGFILLLAAGSLAFRLGIEALGFAGQPWNRTLFPAELVFFCGGILAYRLYRVADRVPAAVRNFAALLPIATAPLVSLAVQRSLHPQTQDLIAGLACILIALGIPFLFRATKDSELDSRIGDLSYPVYISHMFIYGVLLWLPVNLTALLGSGWLWVATSLIAVVVFAIGLDRWIASPIDAWRKRFGARTRPEDAPRGAVDGVRSGVPG